MSGSEITPIHSGGSPCLDDLFTAIACQKAGCPMPSGENPTVFFQERLSGFKKIHGMDKSFETKLIFKKMAKSDPLAFELMKTLLLDKEIEEAVRADFFESQEAISVLLKGLLEGSSFPLFIPCLSLLKILLDYNQARLPVPSREMAAFVNQYGPILISVLSGLLKLEVVPEFQLSALVTLGHMALIPSGVQAEIALNEAIMTDLLVLLKSADGVIQSEVVNVFAQLASSSATSAEKVMSSEIFSALNDVNLDRHAKLPSRIYEFIFSLLRGRESHPEWSEMLSKWQGSWTSLHAAFVAAERDETRFSILRTFQQLLEAESALRCFLASPVASVFQSALSDWKKMVRNKKRYFSIGMAVFQKITSVVVTNTGPALEGALSPTPPRAALLLGSPPVLKREFSQAEIGPPVAPADFLEDSPAQTKRAKLDDMKPDPSLGLSLGSE